MLKLAKIGNLFGAVMLAALTTACSSGDENKDANSILVATPVQIRFAEDAIPVVPRFAEIYNRSCRTCHAVQGMEAPLTGHGAAWRVRYTAKGLDGLLATTKTGLNSMPAKGMCADCTDEDFQALISFMMKDGS